MSRRKRRLSRATGLIVIALAIAGCAQPFDADLVTQVSDETSPAITITTPPEGSSYAAVVLVEGSVTDEVAGEGGAGRAVGIQYDVLSTSIAGSTTVGQKGEFSFSFETSGLSGSLTLRVAATDWNGNVHEEFLSLTNEGAIPSFRLTPGNKEMTLVWDEVPLAESYAVRYAGTGRVPSESSGVLLDDVSSPLTVTGLANGGQYSFLLEARHSGGASSWSDIISAVPLSRLTLVPRAEPGFGQIAVNWNAQEGVEQYELMRSTDPFGPFAQLTGARTATTYTDLDVQDGTRYYYAVRPSGGDTITSDPTGAETTPFPRFALDLLVAELGLFITGQSVVVDGDLAYIGSYGAFFSAYADLHVYDISSVRSPVQVGSERVFSSTSAASTSRPRDMELSGSLMYMTSGLGRIHVVDVSDPAAPAETLEATGYTQTRAIEIDGPDAYVADGPGGVWRVPAATLSTTSAPNYATTGEAYDLVVRNGYAFVAAGTQGLVILDLSGSGLAYVTELAVGDAVATSLHLEGDLAYVGLSAGATSDAGLAIMDVSAVATPVLRGSFSTTANTVDVSVVSGRAYLSQETEGVAVADVNDPTKPKLISTNVAGEESLRTHVSGSRLFNAGNPAGMFSAFQVNPYPQPAAADVVTSSAGTLKAVKNGVMMTTDADIVRIYNTSTGALVESFTLADGFTVEGSLPDDASGHGDYFFFVSLNSSENFRSRLHAIRIDSPSSVTYAGHVDIDAIVLTVVVDGDFAYLGGFNAMLVVDISNPASMEIIGFESVRDLMESMTKSGDTLVGVTQALSGSISNLVTVDVSNPRAPQLLGTAELLDQSPWVGVSGSTVFAALGTNSGTADLQIADISNPGSIAVNPIPIDLTNSHMGYGTIQGHYLYAQSGSVIDIVDIGDPDALFVVTSWSATIDSPAIISGSRAAFSDGGTVYRARLLE